MINLSQLPTLNAFLNGLSTLLLVFGFWLIRRGHRAAHRAVMLGAFTSSSLFLVSYLVYHAQVGSKRFPGTGALRTAYLTLLASHTILAATVPWLAIAVLVLALRGRFERHRKLARWALPIWLYVSITGVVIYWMLYRL